MYDFDELRPATDALWTAIAARLAEHGIAAPAGLTRGRPPAALWADPGLLLAQTCGLPLVTTLQDRVRVVATPAYSAPGCAGASYRSAIVVRAADPAPSLAGLRGRSCAINGPDSNSGMNLLRHAVLPFAESGQRFFGQVLTTGSHAASIRAVAQGRADVAAIDCVTWAHLQHLRPAETGPLRVLAWTAATPGLPLITARQADATLLAALRQALDEVAADPALAGLRTALRLTGFVRLEAADYDVVAQMTALDVVL